MRQPRILLSVAAIACCALLLLNTGCSKPTNTAEAPAPAATPESGASGAQPAAGGAAPAASNARPAAVQPSSSANNSAASNRPADSSPASAPAPAPAPVRPEPKVYKLPAGTTVAVRTTNTITTKQAKDGDRFVGTLQESLIDGNYVIAKKGSTVEGVVVESDPGGRVKGVATISVKLTQLSTSDGGTLAISTGSLVKEAKTSKKKDALKVGIGAGIGAAIGAIAGGGKGAAIGAGAGGAAGTGAVLATRGEPAVIPAETVLSFRLSAPVQVTVER